VTSSPTVTASPDPPPSQRPRSTFLRPLLVLLALACPTALSLARLRPPQSDPTTGPAAGFSTPRALTDLQTITQEPHPLGSPDHSRVRDYLLAQLQSLNLETALLPGVVRDPRLHRLPTHVENILARLPGRDNTNAVLLACHYDSAPVSHGAGDDGAAVAALLETLRCLKSQPTPLRNDVYLLITDGEERGLLGAIAFAQDHPDVIAQCGIALNFDARGTSGPSIMYETSAGNAWLIQQFAAADPRPTGNSLTYDVYRRMPNGTDFTIFKLAGIPGLNFAFIGSYANYHAPTDDPAHLDPASLRHHGLHALALARHFGNLDLTSLPRTNDAVYFDLLSWKLIHYPPAVAYVLAAVCLIFVATALYLSLRRRRATALGVLLSMPLLLGIAALTTAVAWVPVKLLPAANLRQHPATATLAFCLLALTTTTVFLAIIQRGTRPSDSPNGPSMLHALTLGSLILWTVTSVAAAIYSPGATFIIQWPLLFALCGLLATLMLRGGLTSSTLILLTPVPALLLIPPLINLVFLALTLQLAAYEVLIPTFLLWLLIPHLSILLRPRPWILPTASAIAATICFILASAAT